MKKLFYYWMIVALLLAALTVTASAAAWSGSGTEASPYLITNESQLRQLAADVKSGNSYNGKHFKVTTDIALTDTWMPIGTETTAFRGSFDGNDKSISNMTVSGDYSAMFAYVGSGAEIRNVILTDYSVSGLEYLSGLVAYADAGTGSISITDCHVNGELTDIGPTDDLDDDDYVTAIYIGGIVAYADAEDGDLTISGCTSDGNCTCDDYGGGIVGYGQGSDGSFRILNCTNNMWIKGGSNSADCGGIAGYLSGAEVEGCMNRASVSGNAYSEDNGSTWLGGIAGQAYGTTFIGCGNYGGISTFFASGIAGGSGNVYDSCYNGGSLTHSSDGYGDPIGRSGKFTNCYYTEVGYNGGPLWQSPAQTGSYVNDVAAVTYSLRDYFGLEIGVDTEPQPLTEDNRIYRITIVGEIDAVRYANYGDTVEMPELSECSSYYDGTELFEPDDPVTSDLSLIAKGTHAYADGVCTACGMESSGWLDMGSCGESAVWVLQDDGTLVISGSGDMFDYSGTNTPWYSHASSITAVRIEKYVTSIGAYAFYNHSKLASVVMADTVEQIGNYAFYYCNSLAQINFGSELELIGRNAFYSCRKLASVTIPASVTELGENAFGHCTSLASVTFGSGMAEIPAGAFSNCTALNNVEIGAGITTIGEKAFSNCTGMTEITFRNQAPQIANTAFQGDTVLCVVPTYSSDWAEIVSQNFGGTLSWIVDKGLISTDMPWRLSINGTLTISGTGDMYNFSRYYSEQTTAPWRNYLEQIRSIVIEEGVTGIGTRAFYGCVNLTSVTIPDSVTRIGTNDNSMDYGFVFGNCTSLTQFTIPKNVTVFSPSSFAGCSNLTAINVESGSTAFYGSGGIVYNYNGDTLVCYPNGKTGDFTVPSYVRTVGPYAFYGCSGLTGITMSSYTTTVDERAFAQCTNLVSVDLGYVTTIKYYAFYDCTALTELTLPSSVATLYSDAFSYCTSLKKITFEGSAPSFASYVFEDVVADVYYPAENTSWTVSVMKNYGGTLNWKLAAETVSGNITWKVDYVNGGGVLTITGTGAMENYTTDTVPWKAYLSNIKTIVISEGITSIGEYAFRNCTALTDVTLPESITAIGANAFYGCNKLNKITMGSKIKTIGDYAFSSCSSLTALTVPDSVTTIGTHAFSSCSGLKTVTIGNGVTSIGNYAFNGCTSMTTLSLGSRVSSIGNYAFSTLKLTKVTIPASVTSIGTYAFRNCTTLQCVEFLGNAPTIGSYAFANVVSNVYYPSSYSGWSASGVKANYGGTLTWGVISARGTSGKTEWIFDNNGTLTVLGTGAMSDWSAAANVPWAAHRTGIKKVIIGSGVTSVGSYAFSECTALTEVQVAGTVTDVESNAFANCTELQLLKFSGNRPYFGTNAFANVNGEVWYSSSWSVSSDYGGDITWRRVSASGTCSKNVHWALTTNGTLVILGSGAMPDYVYTLYQSQPWYDQRSSITAVEVVGKITAVGQDAFYGCTALKKVTLCDSVISIESDAFYNCTAMTEVTIGEGVTEIGSRAFYGCTALKKITFEGNGPTISSNAFTNVVATANFSADRTGWGSVITSSYGGTLTWCGYATGYCGAEGDGTNLIWELHTDTGILSITGTGAMKYYASSSSVPWYSYNSTITHVDIGDGVTSIGERAFYGCGMQTVDIPDSVTRIDQMAFYNCRSLQSIDLPETLSVMGTSAFSGCSGLKTVRIPAGVTAIGNSAFSSCGLQSVELHDNVTTIGEGAFAYCPLTSVTIPDSVRSIGVVAFRDCSSLTTVTFRGDAPSIGYNAFMNVTATVYYPRGNETWTDSLRNNYQGSLTWMAMCMPHNELTAPAIDPTCTETGLTEGKFCTVCDEVLVEQQVIPATGHTESAIAAVEPTCNESGTTEGKRCSTCGEILLATQSVPALGHRVRQLQSMVVDPLTVQNASAVPFTLTGETYYSNNKAHNSSSEIQINAQYACSLTLTYGVSSEQNFDKLFILQNSRQVDVISGSVTGKTVTLTLAAGDVVTVRYSKDGSQSNGEDRGWVSLDYDHVTAMVEVDVPADSAEPDCTNPVACYYCETVLKPAVGHRVTVTTSGPKSLLTVYNDSSVPFVLSGSQYRSNNHSSSSTSQLRVVAKGSCTLSLTYGVSSERNYDKLTILHNSQQKDIISGTVAQKSMQLNLSAGDTVIIKYSKDGSQSSGDDCGWVEMEVPIGDVEPDCINAVVCGYCEAEVKAALGHAPGAGATCTTAQTCTVCGAEIASALGHTPGAEATCTTAQICTVCGAEVTSALGHTPGAEATCTAAQTCTVCGTELAPANGHAHEAMVTAPTCTTDGYTTYICACGDSYVVDAVPAKGHAHEAVVTAPTCTEEGYTTYTCACGDTYVADKVPALGHTPGAEATCT
ncbi:MAG: leucine-rich repeat domain-containing protein, partial [Clostridia bacterium]|nr:leucine-rich repeat domain-containing protein [Clostridia bacterium]